MDSATHLVMGIALGGLSLIDPTVAASSATFAAVMGGTILGSQAPDADTVLKLRNNAVYIRHHRGITHSIPAVLLWPILIATLFALIIPNSDVLHLWIWTQIAVALHVFVDIFNAYGTQALRPFSNKWIAFGIINTFDPIIFIIHCIAIGLWAIGFDPTMTFSIMFIILFFYYCIRYLLQRAIKVAVHYTLQDEEYVIVAPTLRFFHWRVAAASKTHYYVGRAYRRSVSIYDKFEIHPLPRTEIVNVALQDPNFQSFINFSPLYRWEMAELENGYTEIRLIDLRYRSNNRYPFVAIAHVNEELLVVNSFTGWIYSEEKLQKKLQIGSSD